jgi:hypothetical protein
MAEETMSAARNLRVDVESADALTFEADVLALKHAQALYGLDLAVWKALRGTSRELALSADRRLRAKQVLFLGVTPLSHFGYSEIRDFARRVLATLANEAPATRHLALTIHGPGYGLDEVEAFESELAGLSEAVGRGEFPPALERITFVERNAGRATRLRASLQRLLPDGWMAAGDDRSPNQHESPTQAVLRSAGRDSAAKPHVFVAMPFAEGFEDIFYFGVQGPVHAAGYLCERADLTIFTGDVVDWIKRRIASATFVVADLTSANPNVYLEVGYAWGCRVPTLLLVRDTADLKFDTRGQRCLVYKTIKQLEDALRRELQNLSNQAASAAAP